MMTSFFSDQNQVLNFSPFSIRYTLVAVDRELGSTTAFAPIDTPYTALRGNRRLKLYVVHADEAHYAQKLIKLEDQKVGMVDV